jgi:hypothetical protein
MFMKPDEASLVFVYAPFENYLILWHIKEMTLRLQVYPNMPTKKETIDRNKTPLKRVVGFVTPSPQQSESSNLHTENNGSTSPSAR